MGHELTGTFKTFEDCAIGKAKKACVCKLAVGRSKIRGVSKKAVLNFLGERMFFNFSSPSIATMGKNIGCFYLRIVLIMHAVIY